MKRPIKYQAGQILISEYDRTVYRTTDIDPLLDELEQMKAEKKPFPSLEEFKEWFKRFDLPFNLMELIHSYFSQFQYEKTVFPKVGDTVEGETHYGYKIVGRLTSFYVYNDETLHVYAIRPVTTPSREEVIKSINNKLENGTDKIIFDRELVEQFLNILKGQDDE
jgi:hypothetical protein